MGTPQCDQEPGDFRTPQPWPLEIEMLFQWPTTSFIRFNKVEDRSQKWQIQSGFAYQ
jgi:hypothetical protein